MNGHDSSIYCVIEFLELPFKGVDGYVCIPSSWIRSPISTDRRAIVSYPVENTGQTERRVKRMQRFSKDWCIYMAVVKYETDYYKDAQIFINKQMDYLYSEYYETSNSKRTDHELSRKETQESSMENNTNRKTAVPQVYEVLKNSASGTKIKLKRVKNGTSFGLMKPPEFDNEVKTSSCETSASTNENQLTPTHADFSTKNYCRNTQKISVKKSNDNRIEETSDPEKNTNSTASDIQKSLDPETIAKNDFYTGFFKFLRGLPPAFLDMEKLSTAFNKNPEKTKEQLKSIINRQTSNSKSTTESKLEDASAEEAKICGRKRNAVPELDDDDQVLKKKRWDTRKCDLPPEYDENDSRWTLKYQTSAPGLVELMPNTSVYINAGKLNQWKKLANDCDVLARVLFLAIFKTSALRTCSLTGANHKTGESDRPGLNENAINAILEFVIQYGRSKGWRTFDTTCILSSIRKRMRDMRRYWNFKK